VVLVLEGVVEARCYAIFGAFVTDPAVVVDPARQRFELVIAAERALEVGIRHGEFVGGFVVEFVGRFAGVFADGFVGGSG
jgi:hypothetical protein